jgi:molybdopterin-guanine dinucleotide biosynthesis protein A
MGRPKAWLPWRGVPMLEHVVSVLHEVVDEIVVVTSATLDPPPVRARIVRDSREGWGPLAGIAEGLAHVEADLAFVTSTDAPFLSSAFVRALFAYGSAAAPEIDGFVQSLAAVYPRSGLECAERLLTEGRRRPLDLLETLGYRKLEASALPDLDSVRGVNTADAYLAAVARDQGTARASLEFVGHARQLAQCEQIDVPVGRLSEVLAAAPDSIEIYRDERIAEPFVVSLGGRDFVRDGRVPIGPGERVIVLDSPAGG